MEQYLTAGEVEVNERETFKTYVKRNEQVEFGDITGEDVQNLKESLKKALAESEAAYKKELRELRREMDVFNMNLLKILDTSERKEKFVPKVEANVIKYAMFNTKVVSWLLLRKLLYVLKNLIRVGKLMKQQTNKISNLDLIKFNVTDLMRAMVTGSQADFLEVGANLKRLEGEGELTIIKIKSRFGTPLNDAMIIFSLKDSFLLCELQLVLMEDQAGSEKLKNIEFLNHFLYELERSPYGVLSELAVVLGYKGTKVNYENQISFVNSLEVSISDCESKHKKAVSLV